MSSKLTAVTIGAGWAGEGHTKALEFAGVEVQAICARKLDVVHEVAKRLNVAEASVNWRETLERVKPNIVAIATPAALREPVIEVATDLGCHIYCDKPLATTADEAGRIYQLAKSANVKHAYAATHRYDSGVTWLNELLMKDTIGTLRDIVVTTRGRRSPSLVMPWSWMQTLDAGGGALNNGLPHMLGILQAITDGRLLRSMGEARVLTNKAPVIPDLHDYRDWLKKGGELTREDAAHLEWRPVDADNVFSALFQFRVNHVDVSATILFGVGQPVSTGINGIRLYGDKGTLATEGTFYLNKILLYNNNSEEARELKVPQRLKDQLPQIGDFVQNRWCALARDFLADIKGQDHQPYLTFRDGWRYQLAIESIRNGHGWLELPGDDQ